MTANQRNKALKFWLEILLFLAKLSAFQMGQWEEKNSLIKKTFTAYHELMHGTGKEHLQQLGELKINLQK